jgi:hypothetical protein
METLETEIISFSVRVLDVRMMPKLPGGGKHVVFSSIACMTAACRVVLRPSRGRPAVVKLPSAWRGLIAGGAA